MVPFCEKIKITKPWWFPYSEKSDNFHFGGNEMNMQKFKKMATIRPILNFYVFYIIIYEVSFTDDDVNEFF